ncbi:MAG: hypothetical protein VX278_00025, partial [Myxococcota bacterium]|nr:hypothetical protein [Myxococcota bacterium]
FWVWGELRDYNHMESFDQRASDEGYGMTGWSDRLILKLGLLIPLRTHQVSQRRVESYWVHENEDAQK